MLQQPLQKVKHAKQVTAVTMKKRPLHAVASMDAQAVMLSTTCSRACSLLLQRDELLTLPRNHSDATVTVQLVAKRMNDRSGVVLTHSLQRWVMMLEAKTRHYLNAAIDSKMPIVAAAFAIVAVAIELLVVV